MKSWRKKLILGVASMALLASAYNVGAFVSYNGLYSVVHYFAGDITDLQNYQYNFNTSQWEFVADQGWQFHSNEGYRWYGWENIQGFFGASAVFYSPDGQNALFDSYVYSNYIVCAQCP